MLEYTRLLSHPVGDPESNFDLATHDIRHLEDWEYVRGLKERRYDCLVAHRGSTFCGLTAYQMHEKSWNIFALRVHPDWKDRGIAKEMLRMFLCAARDGVPAAFLWAEDRHGRLGSGDGARMKYLHECVVTNKLELPFRVAAGTRPG